MKEFNSLAEFAAFAKVSAQRVEAATKLYPMHFVHGSSHEREGWARTFLHPTPNDQDCAYCRAMAGCPAARSALEADVGQAFDVIAEDGGTTAVPDDFPDVRLANAMRATGFLEDWIKAVRAEVERRLLAGKDVKWGDGDHDGYGLELGREGARQWKSPDAVEELLRKTYRIKMEHVYDMKLISPTSAEKLAKVAKRKKGDETPVEKPVLKDTQWEAMQKHIVRNPPKPSVKLLAAIKEPYSPVEPDADAFDVIEELKTPSDGVELW